jgi:hypothetical protein
MVLTKSLRVLSLVGALALPAAPLGAQIPDKFTNLQVLPKDITRADLVRTMRTFAGELGVRCHHCHVGPDDLKGMDFAVDTKPTKKAAREMIRMVQHINGAVIPALPAREGARESLTCYTCHRRAARPPLVMHEELLRAVVARGAAAGPERYRELRREWEIAGKYDFGPQMLFYAVSILGEKNQLEGALALAQLGVELNPDSADAHVMLGQVQRRRGDVSGARESFRKALERDARHEGAQRNLKEMDAPAPK